MHETIKVQLDSNAFEPVRAHEADAGMDIKSPISWLIPARGSATIDTGVHIEIPPKYVGMLKSKSGLNVKHGITSEGVVDSGYTGSVRVKLYNNSDVDYQVNKGDKISQLVIIPIITPSVEIVDKLEATERGDAGFGSSGR